MSIGNVMQKMLDKVNEEFPLTEKNVGEFANVKAKGMKFQIKQYEAKGLGNVSVMEAKGFFGLMQMDTLIINPLKKDLPLFSYDRILAMDLPGDSLLGIHHVRINPHCRRPVF